MQYRTIDDLLQSYPRRRPPLSPRHQETYVQHYRSNRSGASRLQRKVVQLESWMHRRVAAHSAGARVLELGAGTLNHLPYHPQAIEYDAVEPFRELWQDSPNLPRVHRLFLELAEVPPDRPYDSILSVAVLEHLTDLPAILARSGLLLTTGGRFCAGFPSEGGLLWGLAWRLTTGVKYRWDHGLDYGSIMRHEHVNTAGDIVRLLRHFFDTVSLSRFPAGLHNLSFYTAAVAGAPKRALCERFLAGRETSAVPV